MLYMKNLSRKKCQKSVIKHFKSISILRLWGYSDWSLYIHWVSICETFLVTSVPLQYGQTLSMSQNQSKDHTLRKVLQTKSLSTIGPQGYTPGWPKMYPDSQRDPPLFWTVQVFTYIKGARSVKQLETKVEK